MIIEEFIKAIGWACFPFETALGPDLFLNVSFYC